MRCWWLQIDGRLEAYRAAAAAPRALGRTSAEVAKVLAQLQARHKEKQQASVQAARERQKLQQANVSDTLAGSIAWSWWWLQQHISGCRTELKCRCCYARVTAGTGTLHVHPACCFSCLAM
jgi:hypothetical protein